MGIPSNTVGELKRTYELENRGLCERGVRTIAWICLLILPPFILVDATRFPKQFAALSSLRLVSFLVPIAALILVSTPVGKRFPRAIGVLFSIVGVLITTAMMARTGGHASPYFSGVGLSMLLAALLMPWPPTWTWLTCAALIATYVVGGYAFGLTGGLTNNLSSYVATMLIAGFATTSRERLRWREFLARQALLESQARLEEDAATAGALARAGREMMLLDAPRMLDRLCRLTAELLSCDFSHTLVWDGARDVWTPGAHYGDTPQQWESLRRVETPAMAVAPLLEVLRRDGLLQVETQALAGPGSPFEVPVQTGITVVMFVPLYANEQLIGVHTAGFRGRTAHFSAHQQRVAIGIAQLASMALANADLHTKLGRQTEAERAARESAELASRVKDDFLATLSHELRTPLNVILGYLDLLDDEEVDPVERARVLARLRETSQQLFFMITDTLEISRLHSGQAGPQISNVSLCDFWRQLREQCDKLPRNAGVDLVWQAVAPDLSFATDPRMLLVVLRNLISNGLKFTERGRVEVTARKEAKCLTFCVVDTGIGIAEDARRRIFDMFHQVDASNRRRHGGVGLGLYIVDRFSQQLCAEVTLESTLGSGSTFAMRLPLKTDPPPQHPTAETRLDA